MTHTNMMWSFSYCMKLEASYNNREEINKFPKERKKSKKGANFKIFQNIARQMRVLL